MKYVHRWTSGEEISFAPGKVVCVGRNYAEHARELNNPILDELENYNVIFKERTQEV